MDLGLKARTALIMASSRGLGLACATALAREGCHVFLNGRNQSRLDEAAAMIAAAHGVRPDTVVGDICTEDGRRAMTYRANFPDARFDIIERDRAPIGRIVVNRPGTMLHIVDQAIVPELRNRGLGTAIMKALMDEATRNGLPVRLKVASTNDPSMRLYRRLGFVPIRTEPLSIEMEWRAPALGSQVRQIADIFRDQPPSARRR
jgi:ribosomal protein S18 acetylase RimI-like enzyme